MSVQARVEKREDGNYNIIAKCVICGSEHTIENVTAMQIFMYISKTVTETNFDISSGDVNRDGTVSLADAVIVFPF